MNTLVNLNVHNTEAILAPFAHKQQAGDWEDVKELKGKLEANYCWGITRVVQCT